MLYQLTLKKSDKFVILEAEQMKYLQENEYLTQVSFLTNLRQHSSGYAVFQKGWRQLNKTYKVETIYLHRYIAERFLPKPTGASEQLIVRTINGNKLDCRLKNLEWASPAKASRKGKTYGKTGYRGVRLDGEKYRATIYINRKPVHIGMYDTPEQAAVAYNEKSKEHFGNEGKINSIKGHTTTVPPKTKH